MPIPRGTCASVPLISPDNTPAEAKEVAKATRGTIKDTNDTKDFLVQEGWAGQDEGVTYETLARVLLAQSLVPKTPPGAANAMTAVALLITTKLQDEIAEGMAKSITELLQHSIVSMTIGVREDLELHATKLAETAQAQATIAEDMKKTQEDMAESVKRAAMQVKSYSQAAASIPPCNPFATPNPEPRADQEAPGSH